MTGDEAEDIKRHFNVISEGIRSDVRLVAEGHSVLDLKLDGVRQELDAVRQEISDFRRESFDFQKQVQGEFRDVRALVRFSYADLDERVKVLERDLAALRTRLDQADGKQA
jgi:hypothetical protein